MCFFCEVEKMPAHSEHTLIYKEKCLHTPPRLLHTLACLLHTFRPLPAHSLWITQTSNQN